jgi:hypothetical protein
LGTLLLTPIQAQVTQIVSSGSGDHRVADGREERAGIEGGQRLRRIVSEGPRPRHCGRVDDGSSHLRVAVDTIGSGAQHGQMLALVILEIERALQRELLVASAGARRAVERDRHLPHRDKAKPAAHFAQGMELLQ